MDKISRAPYQARDFTQDHRNMLNVWNLHRVDGLNFFYDNEDTDIKGLVIRGQGQAQTQQSLEEMGVEHLVLPSFNQQFELEQRGEPVDLTSIFLRQELRSLGAWVNHIVLMNHQLSYGEVTRVLDHMVAWDRVIQEGRPRIVLESGTVLYRKVSGTMPRNTVLSLDNQFRVSQVNTNYLCMMGVHAYVVDQYSARSLFNRVIKDGIVDALPFMFRMDQLCCLTLNSARQAI